MGGDGIFTRSGPVRWTSRCVTTTFMFRGWLNCLRTGRRGLPTASLLAELVHVSRLLGEIAVVRRL